MRLSKGFWQTYKESPADAEIPSHKLMIRAGLIHKSGAGLYNYLPMGLRSIKKVENIVREELDKAGCQELLMTVVTPGELWQETGRWQKMGDQMLKFKDKNDRDLCISPTNEEAITDIFRKTVKSYKQLPLTLYQINTKFRDEIRPRFGLMRGREFTMKDAYSFHVDKASLDEVYNDLYKAYESIFKRIGLEFSAVEADAGAMGSSDSATHEFQVIADTGEDEIIYSPETGYAANVEKAQTLRASNDFNYEKQELKEVETPDKESIEDVCSFLNLPVDQSLKALVYKSITGDEEDYVMVVLIGDDSLNELKLKNSLGSDHVLPASDAELKKLGLNKGFMGPGLNGGIRVLWDKAIDPEAYYVVGANKVNFHLTGFKPEINEENVVDLRLARSGDLTLDKKGKVQIKRGIEVAHIFQLGDIYTKAMDASVLDHNGKSVYPLMGCYGIGITRVVAAAIEQNYDEGGIVWPKAIAPYQVYLAHIGKSPEFLEHAEKIYKSFLKEGLEVVFDDRKAGPGFKFKDADLLGLPVKVVLGERDYNKDGKFEVGTRKSGESVRVTEDQLVETIKQMLEKCN